MRSPRVFSHLDTHRNTIRASIYPLTRGNKVGRVKHRATAVTGFAVMFPKAIQVALDSHNPKGEHCGIAETLA